MGQVPSSEPVPDSDSYNGAFLRASFQWQEAVRTAIRTHTDWTKDIVTLTRVLASNEKDSASNTVVAFGVSPIGPPVDKLLTAEDYETWGNIAIKIAFDSPSEAYDTTLRIEREILEYVFTYLVQARHTPNIIWFLGNRRAPLNSIIDLDSMLGKELLKGAAKALSTTVQELTANGNVPMANFLFMDHVPGYSFGDFLKSREFNEYDCWTVLFQIYYTLECFRRLGIRHNDLHLGNILIRKLERAESITYLVPIDEVNGVASKQHMRVTLQVTCLVEFFDMDRAAVYFAHDVERNFELDLSFCNVGECNSRSDLFDTAGFNMCLVRVVGPWLITDPPDFKVRIANDIVESITTTEQLKYADEPYAQLWLHRAEQAKNSNTINTVRRPLHCMHAVLALLEKFIKAHGRLVHLVNIQRNVAPSSSSNATNVSKSDNAIVFSLPDQVAVTIGSPTRSLLSVEHYLGVWPLSYGKLVKERAPLPKIDASMFEALFASSSMRFPEWDNVYMLWNKELKQEMTNFSWTQSAADLYRAYAERRAENQKPLQPNDLAPKIACLVLSCPMYYGILPSAQQIVRVSFSTPSTSDSEIMQYEMDIWTTFEDILTPIRIPLLYNCQV